MKKKIEHIINDYEEAIQEVDHFNLSNFSNLNSGIQISRKYIQKLRLAVRNGQFANKENEIYFFKKQKPCIYGRLKYYVKLYKYLLQKPRGSDKTKRTFIDLQIQELHTYFIHNSDFVKYYRLNHTNLDEFYFLRGNDNMGLMTDTSHFYTDAEFSTSHDNAVAKIIAYDLLLTNYTDELNNLKKGRGKMTNPRRIWENLNVTWIAHKIDAVELIYALHYSGAIKGDIKELATAFEKIFDIDLGNFYRTFIEIRARKIDSAKFLDLLKLSLLNKIDEADG